MTNEQIKLMIREAFNSWSVSHCDRQSERMEEIKRHVDALWWKLTVVVIGALVANGVVGWLLIGGG